VALAGVSFIFGAMISLGVSWVLVTRLERVGERLGASEALLGMAAALAADAPEITSSVSALSQHQFGIGVGVVVGSNVFNLAALLGVGAIVARRIHLHRRVVVLGGSVALWIAAVTVATTVGGTTPREGLLLVAAVLVCYVIVLGLGTQLSRLPLPKAWCTWLSLAVDEEESELNEAIRPLRGRPADALVALLALVVVVVASVAMEHGAARLGHHFHVADAVIGGVVLAAVTSLPNAVAGVYLAAKGRARAALSTALNSNNLNVLAGLLVPGAILGLAASSTVGTLTSVSYAALTALVLTLAYAKRGLSRAHGWLIIALYALFVILVIIVA
jgi:cation:H+ antiporter